MAIGAPSGQVDEPSVASTAGAFLQQPAVRARWTAMCIVLFLAIFLSRVTLIATIPPGWMFSQDELEMTESGLDRLLGVPPTSLAWPGGTVQMLTLPVAAGDFIIHSNQFGRSASGFLSYLSHTYRSPWHMVRMMRICVALILSIGCATLHAPLARLLGSRFFAALLVLMLATSPVLWVYSLESVADAAAIGFAAWSIAEALNAQWSPLAPAASGFLAGLALASRVTTLPLIPLILGVLIWALPQRRWRAILTWAIFAGGGFLLACPYVWIDPLRLAKSVLGNVMRSGAPLGLVASIRLMFDAIPPYLMAALPIVVLVLLFRRKQSWVGAGAALGTLFLLASCARAAVVADRYLLPLNLLALIPLAFALRGVANWAWIDPPPQKRKLNRLAVAVIAVVCFGWNLVGFKTAMARQVAESKAVPSLSFAQLRDVMTQLRQHHVTGKVLFPMEFYEQTDRLLSAKACTVIAQTTEATAQGGKSLAVLMKLATVGEVVSALPGNFDEDERAAVARYHLMSRVEVPNAIDASYWALAFNGTRFGYPDREGALKMLSAREVSAVVVANDADAPADSIECNSDWRLVLAKAP